jgi:hypothetical protein
MNIKDLFEDIRSYYLKRFEDFIISKEKESYEVIAEPEYFDKEGNLALSGQLSTPYRNDIFLLKDRKIVDSIQVDTNSMLSFDPISFPWDDNMSVTINPFQWNFLTIKWICSEIPNWTKIRDWFTSEFQEKNSDGRFRQVVHYISDPYEEDGFFKIDLDLGSATINSIENLLDCLSKEGIRNVTIN